MSLCAGRTTDRFVVCGSVDFRVGSMCVELRYGVNEYGPKRPQATTTASTSSTAFTAIIGTSLRRALTMAAGCMAATGSRCVKATVASRLVAPATPPTRHCNCPPPRATTRRWLADGGPDWPQGGRRFNEVVGDGRASQLSPILANCQPLSTAAGFRRTHESTSRTSDGPRTSRRPEPPTPQVTQYRTGKVT